MTVPHGTHDLAGLIARLEAAATGGVALDEAILQVVDAKVFASLSNEPPKLRGWAPSYTINLDAALTLVPEEWHPSHEYWDKGAAAFNLIRRAGVYVEGRARTPALALCIAALKARLAT